MDNSKESLNERSERILKELSDKFPNKRAWDVDGRGLHFVSEVEPVEEHPEYDKAVEVIISSKPHKHLKMTQYYTILKGNLKLYIDNNPIHLREGDKYIIKPSQIHWAKSDDESWVEIYSEPGWTKEDHIIV
ncbi:MAG: cupin domain-containing protein [Candidatus Dojkabacteria bacterium]